jgi:signal transduction histidine kinase
MGLIILDFDGRPESENLWVTKRRQEGDGFFREVIAPATAQKKGEKRVYTTTDNRRIHAEYATFVDRGFERGFLLLHDVTADLLQAEKEAYGKVIRMMAHEVNNSNAAIVSLLKTILDAAHEGGDDLTALTTEYLPTVILRAEHMTAFMRNFARVVRLPAPVKTRVDLNELLHDVGELTQKLLRAQQIELSYRLHPKPVYVQADRGQLEQVVINAVTNARESIGHGGHIELKSCSHPPGFVVADDGPGIPDEVAPLLFTPFFSNKQHGQGVGLTLSREILEGHNAHYQLTTDDDGWTRLRVSWPK